MPRLLPCLTFAALFVTGAARAHPLDYRIDAVHSQVLFSVDHDGYSHPVGRLAIARGWLRFDPDDWTASTVVADVDTASADLGDPGWDKAVEGHNFLDAANFPLAHFESTAVTKTGANKGVIEGKLTLHGVTLPVQVAFTVNRVGATLFGFETIAGFSGRAKLDRAKFGITAFPRAVGTDVSVRLEVEAKLDRDAQREYRQAEETSHAAAQH
jgi:polyisoprenoid-binding protein YceI